MSEPLWKKVLNWASVITFFALPILFFITQLWIYPNLEEEKVHLDYMREFFRNVTLLVFGLAGLKTWEVIRANSNHNKKDQPPSAPADEKRKPRSAWD